MYRGRFAASFVFVVFVFVIPMLSHAEGKAADAVCSAGDYQCDYPGKDELGLPCMRGKVCEDTTCPTGAVVGSCMAQNTCKAKTTCEGKTPSLPQVPKSNTQNQTESSQPQTQTQTQTPAKNSLLEQAMFNQTPMSPSPQTFSAPPVDSSGARVGSFFQSTFEPTVVSTNPSSTDVPSSLLSPVPLTDNVGQLPLQSPSGVDSTAVKTTSEPPTTISTSPTFVSPTESSQPWYMQYLPSFLQPNNAVTDISSTPTTGEPQGEVATAVPCNSGICFSDGRTVPLAIKPVDANVFLSDDRNFDNPVRGVATTYNDAIVSSGVPGGARDNDALFSTNWAPNGAMLEVCNAATGACVNGVNGDFGPNPRLSDTLSGERMSRIVDLPPAASDAIGCNGKCEVTVSVTGYIAGDTARNSTIAGLTMAEQMDNGKTFTDALTSAQQSNPRIAAIGPELSATPSGVSTPVQVASLSPIVPSAAWDPWTGTASPIPYTSPENSVAFAWQPTSEPDYASLIPPVEPAQVDLTMTQEQTNQALNELAIRDREQLAVQQTTQYEATLTAQVQAQPQQTPTEVAAEVNSFTDRFNASYDSIPKSVDWNSLATSWESATAVSAQQNEQLAQEQNAVRIQSDANALVQAYPDNNATTQSDANTLANAYPDNNVTTQADVQKLITASPDTQQEVADNQTPTQKTATTCLSEACVGGEIGDQRAQQLTPEQQALQQKITDAEAKKADAAQELVDAKKTQQDISKAKSQISQVNAGLSELSKKISTLGAAGNDATIARGLTAANQLSNSVRNMDNPELANQIKSYVASVRSLQESPSLGAANTALTAGRALSGEVSSFLNSQNAELNIGGLQRDYNLANTQATNYTLELNQSLAAVQPTNLPVIPDWAGVQATALQYSTLGYEWAPLAVQEPASVPQETSAPVVVADAPPETFSLPEIVVTPEVPTVSATVPEDQNAVTSQSDAQALVNAYPSGAAATPEADAARTVLVSQANVLNNAQDTLQAATDQQTNIQALISQQRDVIDNPNSTSAEIRAAQTRVATLEQSLSTVTAAATAEQDRIALTQTRIADLTKVVQGQDVATVDPKIQQLVQTTIEDKNGWTLDNVLYNGYAGRQAVTALQTGAQWVTDNTGLPMIANPVGWAANIGNSFLNLGGNPTVQQQTAELTMLPQEVTASRISDGLNVVTAADPLLGGSVVGTVERGLTFARSDVGATLATSLATPEARLPTVGEPPPGFQVPVPANDVAPLVFERQLAVNETPLPTEFAPSVPARSLEPSVTIEPPVKTVEPNESPSIVPEAPPAVEVPKVSAPEPTVTSAPTFAERIQTVWQDTKQTTSDWWNGFFKADETPRPNIITETPVPTESPLALEPQTIPKTEIPTEAPRMPSGSVVEVDTGGNATVIITEPPVLRPVEPPQGEPTTVTQGPWGTKILEGEVIAPSKALAPYVDTTRTIGQSDVTVSTAPWSTSVAFKALDTTLGAGLMWYTGVTPNGSQVPSLAQDPPTVVQQIAYGGPGGTQPPSGPSGPGTSSFDEAAFTSTYPQNTNTPTQQNQTPSTVNNVEPSKTSNSPVADENKTGDKVGTTATTPPTEPPVQRPPVQQPPNAKDVGTAKTPTSQPPPSQPPPTQSPVQTIFSSTRNGLTGISNFFGALLSGLMRSLGIGQPSPVQQVLPAQSCASQPPQPSYTLCRGGTWRAVYSGACIASWQCVLSATTTPATSTQQ